MTHGTACRACLDEVPRDAAVVCDSCGSRLHESCHDYFETFRCSRCGDELWIGAVEF